MNTRPPGNRPPGNRPAGSRPPFRSNTGPRPNNFSGPRPPRRENTPRFEKERDPNEPNINHYIKAQSIRLIDAAGEMVGVVSVKEGIRLAEEAGLDLVEISPNAEPPVCKILDYGKYKYQMQKKQQEAKKKQKVIEIKEIKVRPNIDKHDLSIKLRHAREFLAEGDKVKFTLRFRGREMAHQDLGMKLLLSIKEELKDVVKVDQEPSSEGRQMVMMVSPAK
ncbi:MAG: translation initiation factor IF-3 [Alphaproteobacteria bacterium]|nr:translation initiation factor IF-3 [Alphaproteobacteria bacterium]